MGDFYVTSFYNVEKSIRSQYVFTKCINIDKTKSRNIYKLMLPNGEIISVTKDRIAASGNENLAISVYDTNLIKDNGELSNKFIVTNLIYDSVLEEYRYSWVRSLYSYHYLDSNNISQESEGAYNRALMLGIYTADNKIVNNCNLSKIVIVTDRVNVFNKDINIDTIKFVGNKPLKFLKQRLSFARTIITCNRAIIKNRCVMDILVAGNATDIMLQSKIIEIDHEFLDANIIHELAVIYKHQLEHIIAYNKIIKLNFKGKNIHERDIISNAIKVLTKQLEDIISYGSTDAKYYIKPALSIYISTNYKHTRLLELAYSITKEVKKRAVLNIDYILDNIDIVLENSKNRKY